MQGLELLEQIGSGGMGEVWAARHLTGVPVAVKVLSGALVHDERWVSEFRREVEAMAALEHPGLAVVLDFGVADESSTFSPNTPYLVMERAEGTLAEPTLQPKNWDSLRSLLRALLSALGHAHSRGLIHRDMKPGNILWFGERGWQIADFGLAHSTDEVRENVKEMLGNTLVTKQTGSE